MRVRCHEEDKPEWRRASSPHHGAVRVATPMLVTHGNRNYWAQMSSCPGEHRADRLASAHCGHRAEVGWWRASDLLVTNQQSVT